MANEMMDLDQLADYLQRDVREVTRLASRGYLPGQKVKGQWRFALAEINHWIETQMHAYTEQQLTALESGGAADEPLIGRLLSEECVAVPLRASTRSSVLRELVAVAGQGWNVYDADAILEAVRQREEMASTALPIGLAIPHPHRPLPNALADDVIAYGRTASRMPFGAAHGGLTDVFFLVCCRDYRTHLRVLARLSRLSLRPSFLDELRSASTAADTHQLICAAEKELIAD